MSFATRLLASVLLLGTSSLAGCAFFTSAFDRGKADGKAGASHYAGAECKAFELREDTDTVGERRIVTLTSPQPARVDPLPLRVAKVACGDRIDLYPEDGGESAYVQYHHDFDTRRFDHATAALILTMCNKDASCIGPLEPNTSRDPAARHYPAGLLLYYAEGVDPAKTDAALTEAGVSAELRRHFQGELERARTQVRTVAAEITGPAAEVFIGIPAEVRKERAAEDAKYAALFARFDAIAKTAQAKREGGVDDPTIAALEELRGDYLAQCGAFDCLDRGLGIAIARELFFAHVSRQDALGAQAELRMADPKERTEVAREIDRRQEAAMGDASEAYRKQAQLRDQGLDEGTTKAATGNAAAYDFSKSRRWSFERIRTVRLAELVPGGGEPRYHGGKLAAKKPSGADTMLVFADKVDRYADEACVETRKVQRIESDGTLVYAQKCRATGKTNVYRTKIDPVVVPAREAKALKTGDEVNLVVAGGEPMSGRVSSASRNEKLVQRRGLRLK